MNEALLTWMENFPYIDFGDIQGYSVGVTRFDSEEDGVLYNAHITLFRIHDADELVGGFTLRTGIFEPSIENIYNKIQTIMDTEVFSHLIFMEESSCFDENGEMLFEFGWNEYEKQENI